MTLEDAMASGEAASTDGQRALGSEEKTAVGRSPGERSVGRQL